MLVNINDRAVSASENEIYTMADVLGNVRQVCKEELTSIDKSCGLTESNRLGPFLFVDPSDSQLPRKTDCLISNRKYQIVDRALISLYSKTKYDTYVPLVAQVCRESFRVEGMDWNRAGSLANKEKARRRYGGAVYRPAAPFLVCYSHASLIAKLGTMTGPAKIIARSLQSLPRLERLNIAVIADYKNDVFSYGF